MKRIVGLALGVVGVWLLLDNVVLDLSQPDYTGEDEASTAEQKSAFKNNRKSARAPASVIERKRGLNQARPQLQEEPQSARSAAGGGGASNFAPEYADSYPAPASGSPSGGSRYSGSDSSYDNYQPSSFSGGGSTYDAPMANSAPSTDSGTLASNTAGGGNVPFVGAPVMPGFSNQPTESDPVVQEKDDSKVGSDDQGTTESVPLTCSANVNGGTFPSAISVGLSCSTAAEIKYCVSSGACCDPEVSGTVYTGNIVIGNTDGNYCLSFFGRSETVGKTSPVIEQTYAINQDVPDINSMFVQRYFQTTQLTAMNYLESADFSKDGYLAGQVNFGALDVTQPGITCQTLMTESILADSPEYSFTTLLAEMSIEGLLASQTLQIPMARPDLIYGENNVVTYMVNNNGPLPVYGCSMNKIYLSDFEYFQAELAFGDDPNVNGVREFSGGLNPYGFVDVDPTVDLGRAPASLVSQDQDGQELKVGMFGIFF